MIDLIRKTIDWGRVGNYSVDEYKIMVGKGNISQEYGVLSLPITLNFVMPFLDKERLKAQIINAIDGIKNVEFEIVYREMLPKKEEYLGLYVEHMMEEIGKRYAGITKTIIKEETKFKEGVLYIYTVGKVSADELNAKVASYFQDFILRDFGETVSVKFENHEDEYLKKTEIHAIFEKEKTLEILEEQKREAAEKAKERKKLMESSEGFEKNVSRNKWNSAEGVWRRKKETPADGNIILGKAVTTQLKSMKEIDENSGEVALGGIVFAKEGKTLKTGRKLALFHITDKTTSMCIKSFVSNEKWEEIDKYISIGDFVKFKGNAEWDTFENSVVVMAKDIEKGEAEKRKDLAPKKRVELHAHTKMSAMDGLTEVKDLIRTHEEWGHKAVAITDHGVVQGFPEASHALSKGSDMKIIYGMEGYVFDDRDCINPDGSIDYKKKKTNHIILLVKNQEGMKNLYKLVSLSHINYFYRRPRLPKSLIEEHRDGLIIGAACEAGEVYRAVFEKKSDEEIAEIASFYDYLEIQPLCNNQFMIDKGMVKDRAELKEINMKIIEWGNRLGKPVVATTDAHYPDAEAAIYRNIIMAGVGFKDEGGSQGLYLRTTEEMLEEFEYLGKDLAEKVVIDNTNLIADMIEKVLPVPEGKYPPHIPNADKILREKCYDKAWSIYGNPLPEKIQERLDAELIPIIREGYAVMYIAAQMLVEKSMNDGYLVGSRGSVGSSFAATMAGITEVNPLPPHYICPNCKHLEWGDEKEYDCGVDMPAKDCPKCKTRLKQDGFSIPFQTFLGFEADKEPDIDLNFAGEYQNVAHRYVAEIFGEKNVYKAGTIGTIAEKTSYGLVKKYFDEREIPVSRYEINRLTAACAGVRKTTGQHPGGIIIVPDDHEIYEFCPVQKPADKMESEFITTHFDYHSIDQNLLKLDILGHDVPTMIRQLQDMTGVDPIKEVPLSDPKVNSIFNGIEGLDIKDENYKFVHGSYGIPEFGTKFTRQMLDDTKPDRFADYVRISGFSHGTDVWINNAQEWILSGKTTIKDAISTRDDIMNYLILKGLPKKEAFTIMERVRKGKGVSDEQVALMENNDVPEWYIESCRRIKYMFPRAHAVAYVMMAYRIAYFKVYYPAEFYATYFTTKATDFDADTILKGADAVLHRIEEILAKDKNASAKENGEMVVLEVAYEMYARGYEFMAPKLGLSKAKKFYVKDGKVVLPFLALADVGDTAAATLAEEYDKRPFATIEEMRTRAKLNKVAVEVLRKYGILDGMQETDQISFF